MLYILIIILIASLVSAVIMTSVVWGLVVTGGVPFISTNRRDFRAILEAVELKSTETIYDLGCGKAHLLIYANKNFGAKGVGYELSLLPYFWAKFKIYLTKAEVKVFRQNFFKADLKNANVVFCYLFPEVMAKLELKFEQELKNGSRVVSYGFKLPNRKSDREVITNDDNVELNKIYIYQY